MVMAATVQPCLALSFTAQGHRGPYIASLGTEIAVFDRRHGDCGDLLRCNAIVYTTVVGRQRLLYHVLFEVVSPRSRIATRRKIKTCYNLAAISFLIGRNYLCMVIFHHVLVVFIATMVINRK